MIEVHIIFNNGFIRAQASGDPCPNEVDLENLKKTQAFIKSLVPINKSSRVYERTYQSGIDAGLDHKFMQGRAAVARHAHNVKVVGSTPAPAPISGVVTPVVAPREDELPVSLKTGI